MKPLQSTGKVRQQSEPVHNALRTNFVRRHFGPISHAMPDLVSQFGSGAIDSRQVK